MCCGGYGKLHGHSSAWNQEAVSAKIQKGPKAVSWHCALVQAMPSALMSWLWLLSGGVWQKCTCSAQLPGTAGKIYLCWDVSASRQHPAQSLLVTSHAQQDSMQGGLG